MSQTSSHREIKRKKKKEGENAMMEQTGKLTKQSQHDPNIHGQDMQVSV
jgi:hypothetical protein